MSDDLTGALIALLVPVFFGSGMVFIRVGLVHIPPNTGNFLSLVSGWFVIAAAAAILFPNEILGVSLGTLAWLAMIGFVNFPIGRYLNFMSMKRLGLLRANPILASAPIISAFEGVVFLNEEINIAIGAGTLLAVIGMVVVISGEAKARGVAKVEIGTTVGTESRGITKRHPLLLGYLAAVGSALAYGTIPALGRVAVTELASPLVTAVYTMLFGFLFMGVFVVRRLPNDLRTAPSRSILMVSVGGILMAIGVALLYLALSKAPVVIVSPVFALNAFVSLALAHIFLQRLERVSRQLVLGTMIVVLGVTAVIVGAQI
jgi:drug/metabolite transporter (DMT)-like permease